MEVEEEKVLIFKDIPKFNPKIIQILIALLALSYLLIFSMGYYIYKTNNRPEVVSIIPASIPSEPILVETDSKIDPKKITVQEMEKSIEALQHQSFFDGFQHRVEGFTVTEDFVVNKILLNHTFSLFGTIDLVTQPNFLSKYKGKGSFDIPDRELKVKITDLLDSIGSQYHGNDVYKNFPKWEDGKYTVTIKNYEIGTYAKGVFKLKGE